MPIPLPVIDLPAVLRHVVEQGASDLHIKVGSPPRARVNGDLRMTPFPAVGHEECEDLIKVILPADRLDEAVERFARPILAAGPQAIRLQKALILDWEELPATAAVARGIDRFVAAFDSDEPRGMAGAALARLRARHSAERGE